MEDDHSSKDARRSGHLKGERLKNTQEFEKRGKRWSHGDENRVSKLLG